MIIRDKRQSKPVQQSLYVYGRCVWFQRPTKRVIRSGRTRYFLSIPSMIFSIRYQVGTFSFLNGERFRFSGLRIAFVGGKKFPKKMSSVYRATFPNTGSSGHVCLGNIPQTWDHKSIEELCKWVVGRFWGSAFRAAGDFLEWEKKTKKFPDWVPSVRSMTKVSSYKTFVSRI